MKPTMRRSAPVLLAVIMVAAAVTALAQPPAAADSQRIDVYSQEPVPPQVEEQMSGSVKPATDAPDHALVSSDSLKMYRSSWVRVLDKARDKARAAGGTAIVVTDWGFDPSSTGSVKKTEQVKRIAFDVVRY